MKLFLLLLCAMLLTGCGGHAAAPAAPTQETAPPTRALFAPGEGMRACPLPQGTGLKALGRTLLVVSGEDTSTLTLISGETGVVEAERSLDFFLDTQAPSTRATEEGLSFFDPIRRETLVLDSRLEKVKRIPAPADLAGAPILSQDGKTLYYCTPGALRAWDLVTGIRRPVREIQGLTLTDLHEVRGILQCTAGGRTLLLSAADGRTLWEGTEDLTLSLRDGEIFAGLTRGAGQTLLFGSDPAAPTLLTPLGLAKGQFLSFQRGAAAYGDGVLSYYDLDSGRREGVLPIENVVQIADTADGLLYILSQDRLYCQEIPALSSEENAVYTGPASPESKKMELCRDYAARIGRKYGLSVLIGPEAAGNPPWDYALEPEVLPAVAEQALLLLDEGLSHYPPSVLTDTIGHFSALNIQLVSQITGTAGSVSTAAGVQYLSGTEACIALAAGPGLRESLYHELYHVMETHLLGSAAALDRWDALNPKGFTYGSPDPACLSGPRRAFIDRYAMASPKEDRARLMEYAMGPGNEVIFQSPVLQAKLETLCRAIRQAYGLKKSPEKFLWEQYLVKPLI